MKDQQIKYRLLRAKETLGDAILLFEKGSWNSSVNRLYYAVFYSAIALLLHFKMEVKSHNGVKRKIGELAIQGHLDKKHVIAFGLLSDLRHKGDYDDLFDFKKDMVEKLIEPTNNFISEIESIITKG